MNAANGGGNRSSSAVKRRPARRVCLALGVWALMGAGSANAVNYHIRSLADNATAYQSFQLARAQGDFAVFQVLRNDGETEIVRLHLGTGTPTTIAVTNLLNNLGSFTSLGEAPAVNDAGVVAFTAQKSDGTRVLVTGDGMSPMVLKADNTGQIATFFQPEINSPGQVAFAATIDSGNTAHFRHNGGAPNVLGILSNDNSPYINLTGHVGLNDSGVVTGSVAVDAGGEAIIRNNTPTPPTNPTEVIRDGEAASLPGLNYAQFSAPNINDHGSIVVTTLLNDMTTSTFTRIDPNGAISDLLDTTGPFASIGGVRTFTNHGTFAASVTTDSGLSQIHEYRGGLTHLVLSDDQMLFGAGVTGPLVAGGMTDSGLIVFNYQLDNGETGIAVASPSSVFLSLGTNVKASVQGGSYVKGGVDATIAQVTMAGEFSAAINPPFNLNLIDFLIPTNPILYWDLEFDGEFTGPIDLVFGYDDAQLLPGFTEETLAIYHFNGSMFELLMPTFIDTVYNRIGVTTTSLSPFVLGSTLTAALPEPATGVLVLSLVAMLGARPRRRPRYYEATLTAGCGAVSVGRNNQ